MGSAHFKNAKTTLRDARHRRQKIQGKIMAKHSKKAFKNTTVTLDGNEFEKCVFEGCTLEYDGSQAVALSGSTMSNCTWAFKGSAANAVQFMSALYQSGAQGALLVEATFNQIRGLHAGAVDSQAQTAPAQSLQ
jgi:hypothetical protein